MNPALMGGVKIRVDRDPKDPSCFIALTAKNDETGCEGILRQWQSKTSAGTGETTLDYQVHWVHRYLCQCLKPEEKPDPQRAEEGEVTTVVPEALRDHAVLLTTQGRIRQEEQMLLVMRLYLRMDVPEQLKMN